MGKTMYMNLEEKTNEVLSATISGEGGFAVISPSILLKALEGAKGVEQVSADRRAELDPGINSPYKITKAALTHEGAAESIYPIAALYAMMISNEESVKMKLYPFECSEFAEIISKRISRDMGRNDKYCALVWDDGTKESLLAVYYEDIGFVPAAGMDAAFLNKKGINYVKDGEVAIQWEDPGEYMSEDRLKRFIYMLENTFPKERFAGMAKYLEKYSGILTDEERSRLGSLTREIHNDISEYIGSARLRAMTPAGYIDAGELPEVFSNKIAVVQGEEKPYMGYSKNGLTIYPPLSREFLDSNLSLIEMNYNVIGQAEGIQVRAVIRVADESIIRIKNFGREKIADITGMPNIVQMYHMANVSDKDWNGRIIIATGFGSVSKNNIESIGLAMPEIGSLAESVRPEGKIVPSYSVGSAATEWVVIPTGKHTKYVTLCSNKGEEIVNLLTPPAMSDNIPIRCGGKGILSLDCGTTTTHMELTLDNVTYPESYCLEVKASELCQRITPMSDSTFKLLCSTILLPDVVGKLHPTAAQRFHSDSAPALLGFPNGGGRLMPYSSEDLARLMDDRESGRDLFLNMKSNDISPNSAKASANRQAYALAIASYIQLGYLHALSRGQRNIEVLLAYPEGLRSDTAFREAIAMVEKNVGHPIEWHTYPESMAAGIYVRKIRPDGLPITNGSPLVVADIGGLSMDVDVSVGGRSIKSTSYSYASIISQLSSGLAIMRHPHAGASMRWGKGDSRDILCSVFGELATASDSSDISKLATRLNRNINDVMNERDPAKMLDVPFDDKNRKLLEQLYRTANWSMPINDSFISHWHELWALPIMDIIAESLSGIGQKAAIIGFVGSGSLFLKGLLASDPQFRDRALEYIHKRSGVIARFAFVASDGKPEVSRGMLMAREDGLESHRGSETEKSVIRRTLEEAEKFLPEESYLRDELESMRNGERVKLNDAKLLAGRCVAESITRESYDEFVREISEEAVVDGEHEEEDCYGVAFIYELLKYSAETMNGFDSFESLVDETLAAFPGIADNGAISRRILHFLIAFNVANRNLLRLQQRAGA